MLRRVRWMLTAAVVLLAAAYAAATVIAAHRRPQLATVPAPLATGAAVDRPLPRLSLVDEQGRPTSLSAFRGRWLILVPSMTLCHEVCPMTTGTLEQLVQRVHASGLASQVAIAEATVDPWRDTPSRLRAYRALTGTHIRLLTGTQAEIRRLWRFFGVAYSRVPQGDPPDVDWMTHKPETMDVQHQDGLFIVDPVGNERIASVGMPDVRGHLSPVLRGLLNDEGRRNLAHPQLAWTADDVLDDLFHLMGRSIPASALPRVSAPSPAAASRALRGSPAPLAALHAQAGQLLPGGLDALQARLRALRGHPVVVNAWASWCEACRAESALLASVAARDGRRVAFLGVDANDGADKAREFLAAHPVSYPSYADPQATLGSLASLRGLPTTVFLDRRGKVAYVHAGTYDTEATLEQDVERYALGG